MSEVNLVAITYPTNLNISNAEEFIAYAARVSNPANQNNPNTTGLIKYLIKHKHWSPFEMASMTLEIKTTRDISRQILRHRSFSFQEFSQRYAKATTFSTREARLQDHKNRQNSLEVDDNILQGSWALMQEEVINITQRAYEWALEEGIAKEQARAVLPEGLTDTTLYMAGTVRSWIHYCQLRRPEGTQKEHREVADKCWGILSNELPNIAAACDETLYN